MDAKKRANLISGVMSDIFNFENLSSFPLESLTEFRCALTEESDRGCALMAAAYLDAELEKTLRQNLVDNKKVQNLVFSNNGPLASFSGKIDLAYLLGLIPSDARHDLHHLRKIRNHFAHNPQVIRFSDSSISDRCRELKLVNPNCTEDPRHKFTNSMMGVFAIIHASIIKANPKISPNNINYNEDREEWDKIGEHVLDSIKKEISKST